MAETIPHKPTPKGEEAVERTEKINPWERQPGESEKAYEAFCIYRDAGEKRSINMVYQKCTKSVSLLRRWSVRWRWVERAAAYDKDLERQRHKERRKQAAEAEKRQLRIAGMLQSKALAAFAKIPLEKLNARDVRELLRLAIDIERQLLIDPVNSESEQREDENRPQAGSGGWQLERLTKEELETLEKIALKAQTGRTAGA